MQPIFLILGTPAAGKSTVSRALMRRFDRSLAISVDDLRHMVVSGLHDASFETSEATVTQFRLAREVALDMARRYAGAGFAVAIDDVWYGGIPGAAPDPDRDYPDAAQERAAPLHRVLLRPSLEVTLDRLYARNPAEGSFKVTLEQAIRALWRDLEAHPLSGWRVIDSSALDVEQTVDRILEHTHTRP